jgi:hypothetical protein
MTHLARGLVEHHEVEDLGGGPVCGFDERRWFVGFARGQAVEYLRIAFAEANTATPRLFPAAFMYSSNCMARARCSRRFSSITKKTEASRTRACVPLGWGVTTGEAGALVSNDSG